MAMENHVDMQQKLVSVTLLFASVSLIWIWINKTHSRVLSLIAAFTLFVESAIFNYLSRDLTLFIVSCVLFCAPLLLLYGLNKKSLSDNSTE